MTSTALKLRGIAMMFLPSLSGESFSEIGLYEVTTSQHPMQGGTMSCTYPSNIEDSKKFPLLSFEHGDFGGGEFFMGYKQFMTKIASAGFVICAPLMCPFPTPACRAEQHIHQLDAITAGKALGNTGVLPVRRDGGVGVIGHSTGGMTTLKCSTSENVNQYNIAASVMYNGDGGDIIKNDNVKFEDVDPNLPLFFVTGTADFIEKKGSTEANVNAILDVNPVQPLLAANITGEGHLDPIQLSFFRKAPLLALPFIVAFLCFTLEPSEECNLESKVILGSKLQYVSEQWYIEQLFVNEEER
eukprot:CAMPEP_0195516466 /NCGR_PEP_ID=MMETSP0794_2-20130614/7185_1 /TAXON_ID=515487 /ORGANISM="Stephanopyxis turris, Strain CCMP 815" /LENGTH=299 /DNA_ID=CAMNT_0040645065 /DNA_START=101 /DNA_END=1000 /DNA_ORIENTATION=-